MKELEEIFESYGLEWIKIRDDFDTKKMYRKFETLIRKYLKLRGMKPYDENEKKDFSDEFLVELFKIERNGLFIKNLGKLKKRANKTTLSNRITEDFVSTFVIKVVEFSMERPYLRVESYLNYIMSKYGDTGAAEHEKIKKMIEALKTDKEKIKILFEKESERRVIREMLMELGEELKDFLYINDLMEELKNDIGDAIHNWIAKELETKKAKETG